MSLSVLVVDDQASIRQVLATLIESDDRLSLFGTASNGHQAVEIAQRECPDAIISDVEMPVLDGIEAARLLRQLCPDGVIVMYTANPAAASAALAHGADQIFDKSTDATRMLEELVRLAHEGTAQQ